MEHVSGILEKFMPRKTELQADEYLGESGLVFCRLCRTARQFVWRQEGDERPLVLPKSCRCREEAEEQKQLAEEQRQRRERIEAARNRAITVPAYRSYRFAADDGKTPKLTAICKNYVRNFKEFSKTGQGLMLYGGVGTGKTFYALCIANALIDRGYAVQHTSLHEVIRAARDFDNAERSFEQLMHKDLIVLDDLGTERESPFGGEQIFKFIDGCNVNNVAIVATTNYTLKELEAAAANTSDLTSARVYSRLLEKCFPVKVNDFKRRETKTTAGRAEMARLLGVEK